VAAKDKSQWDFGELFDEGEITKEPRPEKKKAARKKKAASKATPKKATWKEPVEEVEPTEGSKEVPFSVSSLTRLIKSTLEDGLGRISVSGEITNLRAQASGHIYFSLKDDGAQVSCVLFRGTRISNKSLLDDGMEVVLRGQLSVYAPRGQYQLIVSGVELKGTGALQAAFERLKLKLKEEGLFDEARKRPIPPLPRAIGVVTSATGAAIRDVLHVIERRDPGLLVYVRPSLVQGEGAAEGIAKAIEELNRFSEKGHEPLDLILVTRGGGSLEDLWAFNEEPVARAIVASALPVISAVGHEIDFSISDFTADLRAATPSAAAELITEGVFSSRGFLDGSLTTLCQLIRRRLRQEANHLAHLQQQLERSHPKRRINEHFQRLDDLRSRIHRAIKAGLREKRQACARISQGLMTIRPSRRLAERRRQLVDLANRLDRQAGGLVTQRRQKLEQLAARLKLLSPQNTLDRGYSITTDEKTGKVIRSAEEVKSGQELSTRVAKGSIRTKVQ